MVQRYKFESKSQRIWCSIRHADCCFQWFKGTNLKANHNWFAQLPQAEQLFPMVQRYKFESKSQRNASKNRARMGCFQWFKGTNLKANHNASGVLKEHSYVVSNGSKVQIWKQITTIDILFCCRSMLFPMVQRYKFESKSQLEATDGAKVVGCFQWFKGTNLKANHNYHLFLACGNWVVSNGSKVQIWKQITTYSFLSWISTMLFPMVQRYKFESKSQRRFKRVS